MSAQVQTTEVWKIGDREFRSRLLIGTGKFPSVGAMKSALEASGTEIVTVALRRVDLTGQRDPQADMLEEIDQDKYLVLCNIFQISKLHNSSQAVLSFYRHYPAANHFETMNEFVLYRNF
ncbi:MAG: hypothetical protein EBY81_05320 [Verrucomicrobia bacterium]|nr:hypothetical protein [Verrucomicrobiota bacterium]